MTRYLVRRLAGSAVLLRAAGDYAVEARLRHPSATFLDILAGRETFIVSKTWAEAGGDFKKAMNGTGAFRLAGYEPNVRHAPERFRGAWDPACLDRVELTPIPDDRARVNALRADRSTSSSTCRGRTSNCSCGTGGSASTAGSRSST